MMQSEPLELPNLPWQAMQRRLAAAFDLQTSAAAMARRTMQPQWKFASGSGSWLSRARSAVVRYQPAV